MTRRETNYRIIYRTVNRAHDVYSRKYYLKLHSYSCDVTEYAVCVATRRRIRGACRRHDMETLSWCLAFVTGVHWSPVYSSKKGSLVYIYCRIYLLATWTSRLISSRVVGNLIRFNGMPLHLLPVILTTPFVCTGPLSFMSCFMLAEVMIKIDCKIQLVYFCKWSQLHRYH